MRRVLLVLLLVSCRTVSNESRPNVAPSAQPSGVVVVDASPPPPVETALAWGTRPSADGELFPVIDGMCIHAEVWSTKGSPLLTYGAGTGAFSRGGNTTWGRFVDDGLALDASLVATDGKTKPDEFVGNNPTTILGDVAAADPAALAGARRAHSLVRHALVARGRQLADARQPSRDGRAFLQPARDLRGLGNQRAQPVDRRRQRPDEDVAAQVLAACEGCEADRRPRPARTRRLHDHELRDDGHRDLRARR